MKIAAGFLIITASAIAQAPLTEREQFWPLRQLRDHEAAAHEHIFTPEALHADLERIAWFKTGDHKRVLDTMGEFYRFRPEAKFMHYLMMIGALGEEQCAATARQKRSEVESLTGDGRRR